MRYAFFLSLALSVVFLMQSHRSMQEGTEVKCSAFGTGDEQRLWELERLSRTAKEIMDIMVKWDESLSRRLSFPYGGDGQYV